MKTLTCFSLFGLLGLAVACGGSDDNSKPENPYSTPDKFCALWAKAACNSTVVGKCSGGGDKVDACVAKQTAFCTGKIPATYAADKAKACVDAVKKAYADAKLTVDEIYTVRNMGNECAKISRGPKKTGDTCTNTFDCDSVGDYECVIRLGDTEGTCQKPIEVSAGDPCADKDKICPDTHFCKAGTCATKIVSGGDCSATEPCGADLYCASGKCVAQDDPGTTCAGNESCKTGLCASGANICVAEIELTTSEPLCADLR